jgi:UDP-glucose-4-epimerase GalE
MKVLVTGGAGYIGSHTCKALKLSGYEPVALDSLERGNESLVKWGPIEKGSLKDRAWLESVFSKHRFQAVFHFAGFISVGESVKEPLSYYDNAFTSIKNLLGCIKTFRVPNLIFSSTAAVYGNPKEQYISEDHPIAPVNPYGRSKALVEDIIKDFSANHKLAYTFLRYFNACGADPDMETGELHDPETHLIPLILKRVEGKTDSLRLFGNDYPTPDGTCIRDYIHVSDLADAHLLAFKKMTETQEPSVYNLGNGTGFSVKQIHQAAERVCGKEIPFEWAPRREGDPAVLVANSGRAKSELGWDPKYPELDKIIETALRWERKQK